MGDFSRDPESRLSDSTAKHYVGVRLQQGVPLLDTDWNELQDLRRHELASLFQRFIGDGAPSDNDGFQIEALAGGGVGTIVFQATAVEAGHSSIEIDFDNSTAASILGFLPGRSFVQRASAPARLTGNAVEPFVLAEGMTLTVVANGGAGEMATFAAADFADITQATATEVVDVLNAAFSRANATVGAGNDFFIGGGGGTFESAGRLLVAGVEVVNEADLAYTSQPLYENSDLATAWDVATVPALATPSGDARIDLVYIDVWEREVGSGEDDAMVLQAIGIETSVRLRREWAVRVAPGQTDLSGITPVPNHRYLPLARIHRDPDVDGIPIEAIEDLRVRNLNMAKYLKTPIYLERGTDLLDAVRYANIMNTLRTILLIRLQRRIFDFSYADDYNQSLIQIALQDIVYQSGFAATQAQTGNFNNDDGFQFMNTFYDIQTAFVDVVEEFGNEGNSAQGFVDAYRARLEGAAGQGIAGLKPALDNGDFLAAAAGQEAINAWLSQPVNILPEGSVLVSIRSIEPTTNLAFNLPFNITYEIESQVDSPQTQEAYNITASTVSPTTWQLSLDRNQVEMAAMGGRETVVLTVTPRSGSVSARFRLTATSVRNPTGVTFTHESDSFQIGQPPPAEDFLVWAAPPLDGNGRIPISQSDFSDRQFNFQLSLINSSETDTRTFSVLHFVVPPSGDVSGDWHPLEAEATPTEVTLAAGETRTDTYSLFGPVSPAVGSEGTLVARATLTGPDPQEQTLELTFVIVA